MKRILSVLTVFLFVFIVVGCTEPKMFPLPDRPGHITGEEITTEDVGKNFDFEAFSRDIESALKNPGSVTGLYAKMTTEQQATIASSRNSVRNSNISNTVYIVVEFDGYKNSTATFVRTGSMLLTAKGTISGNTLSLKTYTVQQVKPMEVVTTKGTSTSVNQVTIAIPNASISGTVEFDAQGAIAKSEIQIDPPEAHSGATITVGTEEIPVDQINPDVSDGFNGLFAGGYGTENAPYLISTTEQFMNIGDAEFQDYLLKGNNENLYFELTSDINLSDEAGTVAEVFSGTLNGNNHIIYGSNDISHIFTYYFENATFKDLTVEFASSNVTLLVSNPALEVTGTNADGDYIAVDDSLTLTYENVDFRVPEGSQYYYPVRDNNFGFYADGTIPEAYPVENGNISSEVAWSYNVITEDGSRLFHEINITDCDVEGNFIGGFSNSGSAIFIGGQNFDTTINLNNCSFDGTLTGEYVSLLVANANMSYPGNPATFPYECNITANDVRGGNIVSYSGAGSLHFSNAATTSEIEGTITGNYEKISPENALTVSGTTANEAITVSQNIPLSTCERYQVKLSLPTLYWYDRGTGSSYTGETNSNTFTIAYGANESISIYTAKPITRFEAESISGFPVIDWTTAGHSEEGLPYVFIQVEDDWYLVIDYGTDVVKMYSANGLPTMLNEYDYLKLRIALALDSDNKVIGTSF